MQSTYHDESCPLSHLERQTRLHINVQPGKQNFEIVTLQCACSHSNLQYVRTRWQNLFLAVEIAWRFPSNVSIPVHESLYWSLQSVPIEHEDSSEQIGSQGKQQIHTL